MAKQLVNPIERHLEKAVLGVTGLLLVAVIALYLVTSPNQIELGQEKVSPAAIDAKVAQKTADVEAKLGKVEPKTEPPKPLFEEFASTLQPLKSAPLPMAVALSPEVPIVDAAGTATGQADLVQVNRPAKPTLTFGRATIVAGGGGQVVPVDWVTVSSVFDVKAQSERQRLEYGAIRSEVVYAPPEIQRRARRPDGSWSDEDWTDVKAWPAANVPPAPTIKLIEEGGKPTADKEQAKILDKFASDLQVPKTQLEIIRPMPPEMVRPTRWSLPVIGSYREVMKQDDEYLNPAEPPSPDPLDRYGVSGEATKPKAVVAEQTPAQVIARSFQEAQRLLESAKTNQSDNDAILAGNLYVDIMSNRDATAADKTRAEKLKGEATQVKNDIIRQRAMGPRPGGAQPVAGQPVKVKRDRLPVQQVWAHDAAAGSIRNGETYQYRMRFRIYNRLAGLPDMFRKPELAKTALIAGEWSEPSDPVHIEPSSKFFVTSDNQKDEEASLEFYQWFGGVWVKPTRRMKATIGEPISDRQRVPAPAIDNPDTVDNPEVDFVADATVVDFDFDRSVRERKPGATPNGVKFGSPSPSCSMVYVDAEGKLHERFVLLDKVHPEKRKKTAEVWNPKPR